MVEAKWRTTQKKRSMVGWVENVRAINESNDKTIREQIKDVYNHWVKEQQWLESIRQSHILHTLQHMRKKRSE